MDAKEIIKNLHPLEVKVLRHYQTSEVLTADKLIADLGYKEGHANQAFSWLTAKGLLKEEKRVTNTYYLLTKLGEELAKKGTIEERLLLLLKQRHSLSLPEIARLLHIENKEAGSSFGSLSHENLLKMNEKKEAVFTKIAEEAATEFSEEVEVKIKDKDKEDGGKEELKERLENKAQEIKNSVKEHIKEFIVSELERQDKTIKRLYSKRMRTVRSLLERAYKSEDKRLSKEKLSEEEVSVIITLAKKRGALEAAFKTVEREVVFYTFTDFPLVTSIKELLVKEGITGEEAGVLTSAMLESGEWKGKTFRPYNIALPPARLIPGRENPYVSFLEDVKDKLVSLGFSEFDGPLVETEFWNADALFMPQFHPARNIHDVYRLKSPTHARSIEEPYLSNVKEAHEKGVAGSRGWRYKFDTDFTRRLILRSQGTVLSAHQLHKARVPGKYFGIVRCFRYDKVDATHLSDFYQTEGIVLGEDVNLRTLMGFLKMFAVQIAGASEVKYVPGYFPFTEPSIEVHIKHPVLGWFELGGSGIFRPEVTHAMGLNVPVLAWGIGIDRMALMHLGLNDLRELFCEDIEKVRIRKGE